MLNLTNPTSTTKMFLDPAGPVGIARFDVPKYPIFLKLRKQQLGYYWTADEVSCVQDAKDFRKLTEHSQFMFTSNIKRQIVLDTKQGRGPSAILAPIASLPEVDHVIQAWNFFETVHSESYTHIIRGIYPNPTEVLDSVLEIEPILKMAKSIDEPYDALERMNADPSKYGTYEHKKALWRCLNAVNALEGIRFYVSFACSFAFAELKLMEGNAKIIKMIARDENLHLAITQNMIKLLPKEDRDFAIIAEEEHDNAVKMFEEVVNQELDWADYLFENGSMIGLNAPILKSFIPWQAHKRMNTIGLKSPYEGGTHPMPWVQKWIGGSDIQVAPQETEKSAYLIGSIQKSEASSLKGFEL